MAIGAGFQDIETRRRLTSDFANIMQRGRYYEQKQAMDQRRIDRENEVYRQKQMVNWQERRKEQGGARLVGIMASNLSNEEKLKAVRGLQEELPDVDLADTGAGRSMFGAYGMFGGRSGGPQQYSFDHYKSLGLTPEQSQQALERKHLGVGAATDATLEKDLKTLRDATENDDAITKKLVQDRLDKNPRYLEIQKNIEGGIWLSRMKGGESGKGGDFKALVKGKPEERVRGAMGTFDDRYGSEAYKLALTEAMVEGGMLGLSSEQITAGFNEWWDKEQKKNVGRWQTYADRSKFGPQEAATEADLVPPPSPVPPGFFEPRAPSTARTGAATPTGDYDYVAARAAGEKPNAQGKWTSQFKTDEHPNLIIDGLNTKTADLSQVIDVYTQMAVQQLGPSATRAQIIALAKKLAKDKGWKIDE